MNATPSSSASRFSRREFLSTLATAAAAVPLGNATLGRAAETNSVASSSAASDATIGSPAIHVFSKPLTWMSFEETARLVAEAGFGGIDYSVRNGGHISPERVRDELPRAIEAARAAGLKVEMITTSITRVGDKFAKDVLETAAKHGVKCYRMGWISYDQTIGVWNTLAKVKPQLRELAELNQSLGIHGAYQNHAGVRIGAAMWDIFELLREFDPRWLGCQFDIRHATAEGGQSWPVTLRLLQPWIRSIDIKDFRWEQARGKATIEDVPLGEGIVDFAQYFSLVRDLKISAWKSVHLEYPPFERGPEGLAPAERRKLFATAMRKDRETLRSLMAAAKIT